MVRYSPIIVAVLLIVGLTIVEIKHDRPAGRHERDPPSSRLCCSTKCR